ncbi:hypothetical protein ACP70R_015832 [Stipagrostis hirtigluma subsp. patula]
MLKKREETSPVPGPFSCLVRRWCSSRRWPPPPPPNLDAVGSSLPMLVPVPTPASLNPPAKADLPAHEGSLDSVHHRRSGSNWIWCRVVGWLFFYSVHGC